MTSPSRQARIQLAPGPDSPGLARRFVQQQLGAWGIGSLVDDVSLVTTELVTNAVLHARSDFEVLLDDAGDRLRIEVHDRSARIPALRTGEGMAATGRGLRLVELLASAWGAEPTADGKVVWSEFAVPASIRRRVGATTAAAGSGSPAGGGGEQRAVRGRRGAGRLSVRRLSTRGAA